MTSDNYQIQDILHYKRKSYKRNRNRTSSEGFGRAEDFNEELPESPRSDRVTADTASCSCDIDTDVEIAHILHKKCPVIALAQQQLQRLLDETDKLICDNTHSCRTIFDFYILCKDILWNQNKCQCAFILIMILTFIIGLILGAASCGTNQRKFNSPIITCLDKWFIPERYDDTLRSIV